MLELNNCGACKFLALFWVSQPLLCSLTPEEMVQNFPKAVGEALVAQALRQGHMCI